MRRAIDPIIVDEMRQLYGSGLSVRKVAKMMGVSKSTVSVYCRNCTQETIRTQGPIKSDLPLSPDEVVLHDADPKYARFHVTVYQNGTRKGAWYCDRYPTWRMMYEHCLVYGVENAIDFKDIEDCLQPNCKLVHGMILNRGDGNSGTFEIDFLTDNPFDTRELFMR